MKSIKLYLAIFLSALAFSLGVFSCTLQKAVVETDNDTEKTDGNKRLKEYDQKNRGSK